MVYKYSQTAALSIGLWIQARYQCRLWGPHAAHVQPPLPLPLWHQDARDSQAALPAFPRPGVTYLTRLTLLLVLREAPHALLEVHDPGVVRLRTLSGVLPEGSLHVYLVAHLRG